jgi:eight-cysteine-cluster-containing protein
MKRVFIVSLVLIILALSGCSKPQTAGPGSPSTPAADPNSCTVDSDCVCGGVNKDSGACFLGNKDYYEKNVDKSRQCPDFCSGIAGNLVVKCVDSRCIQMYGCLTDIDCKGSKCVRNRCGASAAAECSSDSDCSKQGCSGQLCKARSDNPVMTTCEYRAEYDCLNMVDCGCTGGKCGWKTDSKYDDCVSKSRSIGAPV